MAGCTFAKLTSTPNEQFVGFTLTCDRIVKGDITEAKYATLLIISKFNYRLSQIQPWPAL